MPSQRQLFWHDTNLNASVSSTKTVIQLDPGDEETITLVRIVGRISVVPPSLSATSDGVIAVDLGIGVAGASAITAGSVADPATDTQAPARGWLYANRIAVLRQNSSGTVEDWMYPTVEFDLRAMRKVDRGAVFLVHDRALVSGTVWDPRLVGRIRCLFMK